MSSRAIVPLVAALLLAGPLAGCLNGEASPQKASTEDTTPGGPQGADAVDVLDEATLKAQGWNEAAALLAAFATEGLPSDLEDPPFLYDSRNDPIVGDGKAFHWTFVFGANDTNTTFVVAVKHDGEGTYARELSAERGHPYLFRAGNAPVPGDVIGSTIAAAAVAEDARAKRFVEDHPVSAVRIGLVVRDGDAIWAVHRFTASGFMLFAHVNAETGLVEEIHQFPEPRRVPCDDCPIEDSAQPTPPPKPEDRTFERTMRLSAFDPEGRVEINVDEWGWLFNVTVTAEVPGMDPVDARTLRLLDGDRFLVDETEGTGTLTVSARDVEPFGWNQRYEATIGGGVPSATDQEVTLKVHVEYGARMGHGYDAVDWFGGHIGYRQTEDHTFTVRGEEETLLLRLRAGHGNYGGPFPPDVDPFASGDVLFTLLDPSGEPAATVEPGSEHAEIEVPRPTAGDWTIRAESGDTNLFGTSYEIVVVRAFPAPSWD